MPDTAKAADKSMSESWRPEKIVPLSTTEIGLMMLADTFENRKGRLFGFQVDANASEPLIRSRISVVTESWRRRCISFVKSADLFWMF